ncbi:MAG: serine/threonine protein kinase [Planctomycetes bacterium]|nr:serine/threonine protein kinase [Planctomycetota bacterium]
MSDREDEWSFAWETSEGGVARGPGPEAAFTPQILTPGSLFAGVFRIDGVLGRGGMATVFRAHDLRVDRQVALKILQKRAAPDRLARLRREGELTANLHHTGIVRIHSAGDVDGLPWLAYEVVEGARTLDVALEPLDRSARVRVLRDVATAVGHAHARGIVHRDLKAENVLVDLAGRPRVIDFGLAYHEELQTLSKSGAILGTPLAMAPEQFTGKRGLVGPPTDVWALGVLLYTALTDEHPFEAETLIQLATLVAAGRVTPPRTLDPSVPPGLSAICLACLKTKQSDRYPSAELLAQDLDAWLDGRPLSSTSTWTHAARRARSSAPYLVSALIVALTLAAVLWPRPPAPSLEAQRLLNDVVGGRAGARGELATYLGERGSDLEPGLLAEAHLALALGEEGDELTWLDRLKEARAAQGHAPTRHLAQRREAECLLALEHPRRAKALLEAIPDSLCGDEEWAVRARAELEAGHADAALISLGRVASLRAQRRLLPLRIRALAATGDLHAANEHLTELSGVQAKLLAARLRLGRGDVEGLLREAVASHPESKEAVQALAKHLLAVDALPPAIDALKSGPKGRRFAVDLLRALQERSGVRAVELVERTRGWRRPVLRYLLRDVERELSFRDRRVGQQGLKRYTARAKGSLLFARRLLQEGMPEAKQIERLELWFLRNATPPNKEKRAAARASFDLVQAARSHGQLDLDSAEAAYRKVLEIDPGFEEARYMVCIAQLLRGNDSRIKELLGTVQRQPELHMNLHADMTRARVGFRLDGDRRLTEAEDPRLVEAYWAVNDLEAGGVPKGAETVVGQALDHLDALVSERPGDVFALTLRGFLLLRLNRLDRAGLDLDRARRGAPACGVAAFYRLLLWSRLGRPSRHLKTEFDDAKGQGFRTWEQRVWTPSRYPELIPLLGQPGFEKLASSSD